MATIDFKDFHKIEICAGTILEARRHPRARNPAYILTIDFGGKGVRTSSAQLTDNYSEHTLVGRQIIAVMNFPPKRIAGVVSEVLVLAAVCDDSGTVLLEPTFRVSNGARVA